MKFKYKKVQDQFFNIHPQLQLIACEMMVWCYERNKPFLVTETRTTREMDERVGRVSTSHSTGRAIDIRTRHYEEEFILEFILFFTEKYWELGAYSSKTKKRNLIVYHDHQGWHLHIQLDRRFSC